MIGDVLTSSILFEALCEEYPNAELHYLINTHTYPVVENHPCIDKFIFFTPEIESSKKALLQFAKSIQKKEFDVVVDVYSKISSNIITLFSGAKTKISYHKWYTTLVYNHNVKRLKVTDRNCGLAIVNRMQLLEPLGISFNAIRPKIYLTNNEVEDAKKQLKSNNISLSKPLFMISVLGSGLNKTYPLDYMASVIDEIAATTNGQILFNYIPNQLVEAETIYNACKPETRKQIYFDVFGKSLRSFLALTSLCNAIIGNEGGAINMAKALNIKTFAIFAPWIDKQTWSIFEKNGVNESVHLKDYKPEIYNGKIEKDMKAEAKNLYIQFKPELFKDKLNKFLKPFAVTA